MIIQRNKTDAVVCAGLDDDLVLLNIHSGHFHKLGGVGLAVWNAIADVRTLGAIQAAIADLHEIDRATCFAEVAAFVGDLERAGLVDVG